MPTVNLVFHPTGTSIGALTLDAVLSEQTRLNAHVTQYPVETGSEISDHITQQPEELHLSGVVTGANIVAREPHGKSRLIAAKESLRRVHADRQPITIVSGINVYNNFAMSSVNITRDNSGEKLDIDAQFRQISYAEIERVAIPASQVAATKPKTVQRAGKTAAKGPSVDAKQVADVPAPSWLAQLPKALAQFTTGVKLP